MMKRLFMYNLQDMDPEKEEPSNMMKFFMFLGQAKRTYRTGWVLRNVKEAESICDHMYRMSIMAFLAPTHLDRSKCLIHDLAECIVGDLTPSDNVTKEDKQQLENNAIKKLTDLISENGNASKHIKDLYLEYSSHKSPEAKYVKSLDLLDMFLQAYEYELLHNINLDEFFNKIPIYLSDESFDAQIKKWIVELINLREKEIKILPNDSNLNTILKNYITISKQFN